MTTVLMGDPLGWRLSKPTSVAIGVFDGVHVGHRQVLADVVRRAELSETVPVALTFEPHPLEFLAPDRAPKLLGSIEHRIELLGSCGMDVVGVLPFLDIRDLVPEAFVSEVLVDRLMIRSVAVGSDFRFGRDRRGDALLLQSMGRALGFEVEAVGLLGEGAGVVVSSSMIRGLVSDGEVYEAGRLLGRRFELRGLVIHGDGRGRGIGVPTANLHVADRLLVPAHGVYAAWARALGREHMAVVNIGVRPTFGARHRTVEAHLLDFEGDLYGMELALEFVENIRPERSFEGVEALVAQIRSDCEQGRSILSDNPSASS